MRQCNRELTVSMSFCLRACVGEGALMCTHVRVCFFALFFPRLKFNSHCHTSTRCPRKSSVRMGRQFVSLQRGWTCASLCGRFLFALIPPVALAIRSLSAISPLPCSEGEDGAETPNFQRILQLFTFSSIFFFGLFLLSFFFSLTILILFSPFLSLLFSPFFFLQTEIELVS